MSEVRKLRKGQVYRVCFCDGRQAADPRRADIVVIPKESADVWLGDVVDIKIAPSEMRSAEKVKLAKTLSFSRRAPESGAESSRQLPDLDSLMATCISRLSDHIESGDHDQEKLARALLKPFPQSPAWKASVDRTVNRMIYCIVFCGLFLTFYPYFAGPVLEFENFLKSLLQFFVGHFNRG